MACMPCNPILCTATSYPHLCLHPQAACTNTYKTHFCLPNSVSNPAAAQVKYPATQATLPLGLSGRTFSAIFGTNQSCLEAVMLKRKIMGPGWISLKHPRRVDVQAQVGGRAGGWAEWLPGWAVHAGDTARMIVVGTCNHEENLQDSCSRE